MRKRTTKKRPEQKSGYNNSINEIKPEHRAKLIELKAYRNFTDNVHRLLTREFKTSIPFRDLVLHTFPISQSLEGAAFWERIADGIKP